MTVQKHIAELQALRRLTVDLSSSNLSQFGQHASRTRAARGEATSKGEHAKKAKFRGEAPSLREIAYEEIKQRIITCQYRPGQALSEAAISAQLKIGRTPVHQAFDRLMLDGLVDILPRKGIVVRPLSLDEAFDIIELRLINETYCARLAAERAQPHHMKILEDNLVRFKAATRKLEIVELIQLDRDFHDVLSHASRNPVLADLLRNLHNRSLRFWFVSLRAPSHHQSVLLQHTEIVSAILKRDAKHAANAMRYHIEAFRSNVTLQI